MRHSLLSGLSGQYLIDFTTLCLLVNYFKAEAKFTSRKMMSLQKENIAPIAGWSIAYTKSEYVNQKNISVFFPFQSRSLLEVWYSHFFWRHFHVLAFKFQGQRIL